MAITHEKYDKQNIEQIRNLLDQQNNLGQPRYYEVFADNMKVVGKTCNPDEFDGYQDYVTARTKEVRVKVYTASATSPRNDLYVFTLPEKEAAEQKAHKEETLSGIEIDRRIHERVSQAREQWDTEQLKKDLKETREQLAEAEKEVDFLEAECERYKAKRLYWGDIHFGEIASHALEGIVRRNPKLLSRIPGGEGLAGLLSDNDAEQETEEATHTEASFTKCETMDSDPIREKHLKILSEIEAAFKQEQLDVVLDLLDMPFQPQEPGSEA